MYMVVPGMAIFITVLAFNLFGDGLRDALDPKGTDACTAADRQPQPRSTTQAAPEVPRAARRHPEVA